MSPPEQSLQENARWPMEPCYCTMSVAEQGFQSNLDLVSSYKLLSARGVCDVV